MSCELEPIRSSFLADCKDRYASMTEEQRLGELNSLATQTIQNAVRIAALMWTAKQKGEDLTPYLKAVGPLKEVYLDLGLVEGRFRSPPSRFGVSIPNI